MSIIVCLAPANTVAYPNGGGHLWVYLPRALGLRALGCRVIWLEALDSGQPLETTQRNVKALREPLDRYGLAESPALCSSDGAPLPRDLGARVLDLDAAAEADLL